MSADHVNLLRGHPGGPQRPLHRLSGAFPFRMGSDHVIGVRTGPVSDHLAMNPRASAQRMPQRFQDDDAGAFAHHEAVAGRVKRAAGLLRLAAPLRQRRSVPEAGQGQRMNRRLRPAGDHNIRLAALNQPERFPDRRIADRTGRHRRQRGPKRAVADADLRRRHIRNHHRDKARAYPARSAAIQDPHVFGQRLDPADARSDVNAKPFPVNPFRLQPRILQRLFGGIHRVLAKAVHFPRFLPAEQPLRIEIPHLAGDLGAESRNIKAIDPGNSRSPFLKSVPKRIHIVAQRRQNAHTGNDNPFHTKILLQKNICCPLFYPLLILLQVFNYPSIIGNTISDVKGESQSEYGTEA